MYSFQKIKVKLRLNQERKWQNIAEKNSQLWGKSSRKAKSWFTVLGWELPPQLMGVRCAWVVDELRTGGLCSCSHSTTSYWWWASYLSLPSLHFLIYKMRIKIIPILWGYEEDKNEIIHKAWETLNYHYLFFLFSSSWRLDPWFPSSQSYGFSSICEGWTIKKAEHWRIDAFELWCWRRLLRIPWTARRFNQSILKEISPEY